MNKNNKYGFTLVELLAVIVILSIILVIAVPKVMNVIEDAKKATLESTAKMIASQAEKAKVQNTVLGKNDEITCDSVAKINDVDYASCEITFEDNTAKVTIKGSGKFEGLYVCNGTKTEAKVEEEKCDTMREPYSLYYGQPYNIFYDFSEDEQSVAVTLVFFEEGIVNLYSKGNRHETAKYELRDDGVIFNNTNNAFLGKVSYDGTKIELDNSFGEAVLNTTSHEIFYNKHYTIDIDGRVSSIVFYENGGASFYENYTLFESFPENTVIYGDNSIDMSFIGAGITMISIDGTQIIIDTEEGGMILTLEESYIRFNEAYTVINNNEKGDITLIFYENGTFNSYLCGEYNTSNTATYTKDTIIIGDDSQIFEISDDGTEIIGAAGSFFEGIIFRLDSEFEPLD